MNDASGVGSGPALGSRFAGHRIEAVIGSGGMGVVYRARNLALDRERALKVLAPALSSDARFRERFRRESRLAASIEHQNVIPVHEAGEEQGQLYLSMRLVEGRDLRQLVETTGPLGPSATVEIVAAVAAGLDAAHNAGLVHRDVKPANVLVGAEADLGHVYLTDFGISRTARAGETVTTPGELVGTADFISPEQIAGDPVDHRADIYALGGVLCFALTGEPPFRRENELATLFAHANAPRPRPSRARPLLPAGFDDVIAAAMAVDPDDRPDSAGELALLLRRALGGEQRPAAREAPTRPLLAASRRRRPSALLLGLIALAVAAVAGVAGVVLVGVDEDGGDSNSTRPSAQPRVGPAIDVGESPTGITVGDLRVWVAVRGAGTVAGINPATLEVAPRVNVPEAKAVAVGHGSIWTVSEVTDALYRLDPGQPGKAQLFELGAGSEPSDLAVDENWVWVTLEGTDEVVRFDPAAADGDLRREPVGDEPRAVAVGEGAVWVVSIAAQSVSEIDPLEVDRIGSAIQLEAQRPSDIAAGAGSVWVIDNLDGTLARIAPGSGPEDPSRLADEPLAGLVKPRGVKTGLGYVWIANGGNSTVVRADPATGEAVGEPVKVGGDPADISIGLGAVWTANQAGGSVTRIEP